MICSICGQNIQGRYYYDFWNHTFCVHHYDCGEVATCTSCSAMVHTDSVLRLNDGRCLCKSCQAQVVNLPEQIDRLRKIVIIKLLDEGVHYKDKYLESVPIQIVSAQELARLRNAPVNVNNKGVTITKGISSVIGSMIGFSPILSHKVYILENQIKIEFMGTLAHELLHVWQNENQVKLPPPQCEGLCNLGSWLIYSTVSDPKTSYFLKSIKESPDPVYGDGFRHVYGVYERVGWEGVLEAAKNGTL